MLRARSALAGCLLVTTALAVAGAAAWADDDSYGERYESHDDEDYGEGDERRAREALRQGEVLSLDRILQRAQSLLNGRMLEAELEREDGRWVYEITLLGPDGHVVEALFDAQNANLLELEGGALEKVLKRPAE